MLAKIVFKKLKYFNLLTPKSHIFDHILEKASSFNASHILDASLFVHFSHIIRKCITITFMRLGNTVKVVVKALKSSVALKKRVTLV